MSDAVDYFTDVHEEWRAVLNGAIRVWLDRIDRWPQDKYLLIRRGEAFEMPALDPKLAKSALFRKHAPSVNLRDPATWDARAVIIKVVADAVNRVVTDKRGYGVDGPGEAA